MTERYAPDMTEKLSEVPATYAPSWLAKLDGRLGVARDLRERYAEVCTDLGGAESLSYMQRSLIERGLWLEYWLAEQEGRLATGGDFDVGKWVQAANSLQGIYTRLGIARRARDVPDLQTYLASRASS